MGYSSLVIKDMGLCFLMLMSFGLSHLSYFKFQFHVSYQFVRFILLCFFSSFVSVFQKWHMRWCFLFIFIFLYILLFITLSVPIYMMKASLVCNRKIYVSHSWLHGIKDLEEEGNGKDDKKVELEQPRVIFSFVLLPLHGIYSPIWPRF